MERVQEMVPPKHRTYSTRSGLILGFHGTDEAIVHDVVHHKYPLRPSVNAWDWLGHGIYFWEHSVSRAMEFAITSSRRKGSSIKIPAVLGAVLDPGNCFDLLDHKNLSLLKRSYYDLLTAADITFVQNKQSPGDPSRDFLWRHLDCAVVEQVHEDNMERNLPSFDSVRAAFWEGSLLYPTAGFREKNHIQICIRNPNCIKGFFMPF